MMAAYSLVCGMDMEACATAQASFGRCKVKTVRSEAELEIVPVGYTIKDVHIRRNDKKWHKRYFKFTLPSDARVYLGGRYDNNNHDGLQSRVKVYSDREMTKPVAEYGWGYWEYGNGFQGDLKKGTYYGCVASKYANFDDFTGDICITVAKMSPGDGN